MKTRAKVGLILGGISLVAVFVATGFLVANFSGTVSDLKSELSRPVATTILENAELADTTVSVPILYYDQLMDPCVDLYDLTLDDALAARQFEWTDCGYLSSAFETELTSATLGEDYLPTALGGEMLPNRGVKDTNFYRWFHAEEGKSIAYSGKLNLTYDSKTSEFNFKSDNFYPLSIIPTESVNADGKNHLFTLNLAVPFRVLKDGHETFSITADDDTWVYVGNELVLDLGGVHDAMTARFKIAENGELYTAIENEDLAFSGVVLTDGSSVIRIFHADRDSSASVFNVSFKNMVLNLTHSVLAENDESGEGIAIAYDPADPSYIAPLGESLTVSPNNSRAVLTTAIIEISALGSLAILSVLLVSALHRRAMKN